MIENKALKEYLENIIRENRVAGASILVRRAGEIVCEAQYGWSNIEKKIPLNRGAIFRLASMTKPVIALCIMRMEEKGLLSIEDPVEKYLPVFKDLWVSSKLVGFEEFYQADPDNPMAPKMNTALLEDIEEVPLKRPVTIRDILSHSSGMGQGVVSMSRYAPQLRLGQTLEERVAIIAKTILDFQPGENTGYSASVAYEVLGRIMEIVSGMNLDDCIAEEVCRPLGIKDLGYRLTDEQQERIVRLYEALPDGLHDVSDTESFWQDVTPLNGGYFSGSAGLLGTVAAYDKIAQVLLNGGTADGQQFLKPETVLRMRTNGSDHHMEMKPGIVWGLGMTVTENPQRSGRKVGKGTVGWSGAYGTHFYVDVENHLTLVLGMNCSNIGGADSPISKKIEEITFDQFCSRA